MSRKSTVWVLALVAVVALTAGCPKGGSTPTSTSALMKQGMDLAAMLGKQLGLTGDQAAGSLGSIFALGQEKLPADQFSQLSKAVPGTDKYIKQAKDSGAVSGPIGGVNGLSAAFSKLGIPKETADKIVPTVKQLLGQVGGPEMKQLVDSFL